MLAHENSFQFSIDIESALNNLDRKIFEELKRPYYENRILTHLEELKKTSKKIPFKSAYRYRPDIVAYEELGLISASWVILVLNDISSVLLFNQQELSDEIIIPDRNVLEQLFE